MLTTRKKTLAALSALRSANRRTAAQRYNEGVSSEKLIEFGNAIDTACTVIAAMSDQTFNLHIELADESEAPLRFGRRSAARFAAAVLILLFALPQFAAAQLDLTKAKTVPVSVISDFQNAPCTCAATDTFTVAAFPTSHRSLFVASAFDLLLPTESIRFEIYYAHDTGDFLYLVGTGRCRNYSNLIPLPQPGFYFVRYFHHQHPALIEIDARCEQVTLKAFGKCKLPQAAKGGKRS
jgi:hypothetical protein